MILRTSGSLMVGSASSSSSSSTWSSVGVGIVGLGGNDTVYNEITVPSSLDLLPAPLGDDGLADDGVEYEGAAVHRFLRLFFF